MLPTPHSIDLFIYTFNTDFLKVLVAPLCFLSLVIRFLFFVGHIHEKHSLQMIMVANKIMFIVTACESVCRV